MERNKKVIALTETALRLNRKITSMSIPVIVVVVSFTYIDPELALYHSNANVRSDIELEDLSEKEIIERAVLLTQPKYISIKNACVDLIGNKDIYLNKIENVEVIGISAKGITIGDNRLVDVSELYLKEEA